MLCLQVELKVTAIHVVSRAEALPFEVIDAARSEEEVAAAAAKGELMVTVNRDTRLDSRFVDLRTPANQAIFRVQSGVCQVRSMNAVAACPQGRLGHGVLSRHCCLIQTASRGIGVH